MTRMLSFPKAAQMEKTKGAAHPVTTLQPPAEGRTLLWGPSPRGSGSLGMTGARGTRGLRFNANNTARAEGLGHTEHVGFTHRRKTTMGIHVTDAGNGALGPQSLSPLPSPRSRSGLPRTVGSGSSAQEHTESRNSATCGPH